MATYRERREARAERLQEWADKREARAVEALNSNPEMRHDWAFITQPGHIPQRARMIAADERAFKSLDKADTMRSRSAGITAQLGQSIYSDDPDAIEALEARIAKLEAEREQFKAHNREMRKPGACDHPAECDCRSRFPRACSCKRHPLPSYVLTNLSGNIKRNRDRLEMLKRRQARQERSAEAGGVTVERRGEYAIVTFAEKPSREVLDALRAADFRWRNGSWLGRANAVPSCVLVTCSAGCGATFHYVAARRSPLLCIEHAADESREVDGWTPENSLS